MKTLIRSPNGKFPKTLLTTFSRFESGPPMIGRVLASVFGETIRSRSLIRNLTATRISLIEYNPSNQPKISKIIALMSSKTKLNDPVETEPD